MFLPQMAQVLPAATKRRGIRKSMAAPTGGWNTRDNIANMPKNCAVLMDNWFPDSSKITTRRGYIPFSTGMNGNVNSLMTYQPQLSTSRLIAANAGSLYNATALGAAALMKSGFSSDKWQFINMGTSGGRFLIMFNEMDTAQTFDGTTIADCGITGPDVTKLAWGNNHQRRLWVGEKNSLSAWYGGTNSITGSFTEFPLYGVANKGGYIMGMATWTRDSGDGQDDVAVFLTSEGEAIVYEGIDPSAAATWSLVGVFQIGKPLGRRFFTKAGGDLILLTQDGFVSAASMLVTDRSQARKSAISTQINEAVTRVLRDSGTLFGWQPVIYPLGNMLIVNVPIDVQTSYQYVFNTLTIAPTRFTGMNANCWAVFNDKPYFGGKDGIVYQADSGETDNGNPVAADVLPAFSYFGDPDSIKKFNLGEAIFQSDSEVTAALDLNVDFRQKTFAGTPSAITGTGGKWDTAKWDQDQWGSEQDIFRVWQSINGLGTAAALRCRVNNKGPQVSLLALNYIYENGGPLG